MSSFNLPPSRFTKGTTYHSAQDRLSNHSEAPTVPIHIKRDIGGSALVGNNDGSSPLAGILERAANRASLAREQDNKEIDDERLRLERLFAFPDPNGVDRFGQSNKSRTTVTEKSAADATLAYRFSDMDVKEIINAYKDDQHWQEEDIAELLRDNHELRIKLGIHLLEKFKNMHYLPSRVEMNGEKNPNHNGYDRMSSKEYAALLALSMLDGTFRSEHAASGIEVNEYKEVVLGQHRAAAQMVLGIYQ